jgi:hypothetical protein
VRHRRSVVEVVVHPNTEHFQTHNSRARHRKRFHCTLSPVHPPSISFTNSF